MERRPPPAAAPRRLWRRLAWALAALLVLGVGGLQLAAWQLKAQVEQALGPRASVGSLRMTWAGVEATEVRVRSDRSQRTSHWPAEDELRAQRVVLTPDLWSLLGAELRIHRVRIDGAYLSMWRTREGRLRVLPALFDRPQSPQPSDTRDRGPALHIAQIELHDAAVEFFDASVRQPALQLRLEGLQVRVGPLDLPRLDRPTAIELDGMLKGVHRDGRVRLAGEVTLATADARLKADLRGVDLVALQAYLIKVSEAGVRRGTMDLSLEARVRDQQLHAPGRLTLIGLELNHGGGVLGTFAGVPRQAVLAAMSRNGKLEVAFTLEGRLDDPNFSLNENFALKVAGGIASALGVSLGGVVEGVGSVIKGLFGR
ncbi:DUF748 domain-containing protein [Caldimonas sp.]|uniref:DUF748 domain-containing protein n=1 Tax=Caldimonas sp. TaxID=2838790 RepID=UPI0029DBD355|nr:DUF748 domain-containing protein [Caldimonas manganoxidans]